MSTTPALAQLLRAVQPLPVNTSISEVAECFLQAAHSSFLSLPLIDEQGRPAGLVSRYALQNIFMQRFGRDLWGNKPVSEVMNAAPLVVRLDTSLEEAARQITAQLQSPIRDDFILVDAQGRYQGLGTVLDVLKAMESRIAQRNRVLRQALVDLKESQVQLVQSEKMASLGQMVAGVAHELNTPLGYVTNNVQLLRELSLPLLQLATAQAELADCLDDPACAEERLAAALQTAANSRAQAAPELLAEDLQQLFADTGYGLGQIAELVVGLKDFARLDRAMSEEVDLNDCIRSALLIARNNIKDKAEVLQQLGELPAIACAPSQINQVLLNLLNNAAQAIDGFGRIQVKTWAEADYVLISIEDSGRGMSAAVQKRIFDPFFTTKPVGEGTGLGLSISFKIIQDHGGTIRVASVLGRGTRFVLRLPRRQADELKKERLNMSERIRILFVDDEERILRSLALQFRREYEVLTESDPRRALERLKTEAVHVLVSDQRMPGMSGAELLAAAQQIAPQTLRILLTGYSDLDAAVEALNNGGIFRYLTKPWDAQEMAFTLRQAGELALRQAPVVAPVLELPTRAALPLKLLLLDDDPQTLAVVAEFCVAGGHRLLRARSLSEALQVLNQESIDLLVSDLKLAGEDTAPLLKTLARLHPRLLSLVVTPFQDTQALLKLINEAQIFRYLPKPIRKGLFDKGLQAAAAQALLLRSQPTERVVRLPAAPRDEREREKVGSLLGMLGRLRERLSA